VPDETTPGSTRGAIADYATRRKAKQKFLMQSMAYTILFRTSRNHSQQYRKRLFFSSFFPARYVERRVWKGGREIGTMRARPPVGGCFFGCFFPESIE
jgi:hypothetical protein